MKYFKALGLLFVAFLVLGMYGTYGTYGNNNDNSNIINDQSVHLAPIQEKNKTNLSSIDSNNTITIDKNKAISIAKLYDDNFDCEFYYYEKMDFNAKLSPDNKNGQIMTTWNDFNKNAGKTGFLTLNEVDNTINKMLNTALPEYKPPKFKDILKDFYPE